MESKTPCDRPYLVWDTIYLHGSNSPALAILSEVVEPSGEKAADWKRRGITGLGIRVWHVVGLPGTVYEGARIESLSTKAKAYIAAGNLIDEANTDRASTHGSLRDYDEADHQGAEEAHDTPTTEC